MRDTDLMPWGTHKGTPIGEVPFDYLWKLYKKMWLSGEVLQYFEKQLKELEAAEEGIGQLPNGKKPRRYLIENYECQFPQKKTVNEEK